MYKDQNSVHHELLIIGAGAAGLMAAVTAKDQGIDVAIIEGNDRIGKKIITTGNGRCNITNESTATGTDEAVALSRKYHSNQAGFPLHVLQQFGVRQTIEFFSSLGLPLISLEDGRMYPMSLQAASVPGVFGIALEDRRVPIYLKHKVMDITVSADHPRFTITCQTETGEAIYTSEYLFLCAGGLTAPKTGTDGSGYSLVQRLGHTLIEPVPGIVQLKLEYPYLKELSGIKFEGWAHIIVNNEVIRSEYGEILFTAYGISGPPILQVSRKAAYNLGRGEEVILSVDMMPDRTEEEVVDFLETHWAIFGHRTVADSLIGIINKKLIPIILKEAGIDPELLLLCQDLSWKTKKILHRIMKRWEFKVTDTNSFTNAQTTAGGIDTTEIMEGTLESKLVPGLYFAGEVMDVDGDCGGYNLQWAWSSGHTAAMALAKRRVGIT